MNNIIFTYHGKKYQVDKVIEQKPKAGRDYIQIITKDNKSFKLVYNQAISQWQVTEPSG